MKHSLQQNSQRTRAGGISSLARRFPLGEACGSAILELALVVPVFVLLVVGSAIFGRVEYFSIEASNAARAGAA